MTYGRPTVTVITITRRRVDLLPRAIVSVAAQVTDDAVEHLIVVDDCAETLAFLDKHGSRLSPALRWHFEPRKPQDRSGPGRSAVVRNRGVRLAAGHWIAFIDDDNEWESGHVASLLALSRETGARAVHSWMQMYYRDGRPYLENTDPWRSDPDKSQQRYEWAVEHGIRQPGSHVVRDRMDPAGVADPARTVDTGEWMFDRQLLLDLPLPTSYPEPEEGDSIVSEDDLYMLELLRRDEPVACTRRPTLRYYLGGYSTTGVFL